MTNAITQLYTTPGPAHVPDPGVMTNAIMQLYTTTVLPKQSVSETLPAAISDEQIRKIAQEAADKASEKAMNIRYDKLDAAADTVMHRIYNLVNGAIWAAIPKWI